jgi:hypothetical protein
MYKLKYSEKQLDAMFDYCLSRGSFVMEIAYSGFKKGYLYWDSNGKVCDKSNRTCPRMKHFNHNLFNDRLAKIFELARAECVPARIIANRIHQKALFWDENGNLAKHEFYNHNENQQKKITEYAIKHSIASSTVYQRLRAKSLKWDENEELVEKYQLKDGKGGTLSESQRLTSLAAKIDRLEKREKYLQQLNDLMKKEKELNEKIASLEKERTELMKEFNQSENKTNQKLRQPDAEKKEDKRLYHRNWYEQQKLDPVKYEKLKKYNREYHRKRIDKIHSDPEKYEAYLEYYRKTNKKHYRKKKLKATEMVMNNSPLITFI